MVFRMTERTLLTTRVSKTGSLCEDFAGDRAGLCRYSASSLLHDRQLRRLLVPYAKRLHPNALMKLRKFEIGHPVLE